MTKGNMTKTQLLDRYVKLTSDARKATGADKTILQIRSTLLMLHIMRMGRERDARVMAQVEVVQ